MKLDKVINIEDLHRMAKRRLPRIVFDFIEGGVEDEHGLVHNETAFRRYHMVPRFLVDVCKCDQSITLFGRTYSSPFGIAPTGLNGLFRRHCDLMLAEASAAANIPYIMSSVANSSLEAAAKLNPNMWFQLYGANDRAVMHDMVRRARDAGIDTLVITVDVPMLHKRERNMRNGFGRPMKMTPAIMLEALTHPGWMLEYYKHGGAPMFANWEPYSPPGSSIDVVADHYGTQTPSATQTWRDFETLRGLWPGKIMLKGILHPDDAVRSVDLGADAIYVSNHGARQLDRAVSPIEMLPRDPRRRRRQDSAGDGQRRAPWVRRADRALLRRRGCLRRARDALWRGGGRSARRHEGNRYPQERDRPDARHAGLRVARRCRSAHPVRQRQRRLRRQRAEVERGNPRIPQDHGLRQKP